MQFKCDNCSFKLVNEFCPKCGQRMKVSSEVADKLRTTLNFLLTEQRILQTQRDNLYREIDKQARKIEAQATRLLEFESLELTLTNAQHRSDEAGRALRRAEELLTEARSFKSKAWKECAAALGLERPDPPPQLAYQGTPPITEDWVIRQLGLIRAEAVFDAEIISRLQSKLAEIEHSHQEAIKSLAGRAFESAVLGIESANEKQETR